MKKNGICSNPLWFSVLISRKTYVIFQYGDNHIMSSNSHEFVEVFSEGWTNFTNDAHSGSSSVLLFGLRLGSITASDTAEELAVTKLHPK
jgi:hypothetical protein